MEGWPQRGGSWSRLGLRRPVIRRRQVCAVCPVGEPAGKRCQQGYQRPGTGRHDVAEPRVGLLGGLHDGGGTKT